MGKLNMTQYMRLLSVVEKRRYTEDPIFWIDYVYPYVFSKPLTHKLTKTLRDRFDHLNQTLAGASSVRLTTMTEYLASLHQKFKQLPKQQRGSVKLVGDLPKGVRLQLAKTTNYESDLKKSNAMFKKQMKHRQHMSKQGLDDVPEAEFA